MRLSSDEERLRAAFSEPPLNTGMHSVFAVMRVLGQDSTNPARRLCVERALKHLCDVGLVRRIDCSDGLAYFHSRVAVQTRRSA